jgi:hypothetical protein
LGTPVYSTNKTDRHDITEILLKVVLSTINQTNQNYIDGVMVSVLTSIVVDYGYSIGRYKANYHTITTTTVPVYNKTKVYILISGSSFNKLLASVSPSDSTESEKT